MIPEFPKFKSLELSDKKDIEAFTSKFPPYSDFNFVSMWSWDIKGEMRISVLNGNLVVRFTDYITGEHFLSFLGQTKVNATVHKLLEFSETQGLSLNLQLIPEDSIEGIDTEKYCITENRDGFDYLYDTEKITNFLGANYANARRLSNRFLRTNQNIRIEDLDLTQPENRTKVLMLDQVWRKNKEFDFHHVNEEKAIVRLIEAADSFSLYNVGVFVGDELVAFTINSKLSNQYSISYFAKFNIKYRGSYLHSMRTTCKDLLQDGYLYMNCEQDLGLPGLRLSKESLCPIVYLKKYTITKI